MNALLSLRASTLSRIEPQGDAGMQSICSSSSTTKDTSLFRLSFSGSTSILRRTLMTSEFPELTAAWRAVKIFEVCSTRTFKLSL